MQLVGSSKTLRDVDYLSVIDLFLWSGDSHTSLVLSGVCLDLTPCCYCVEEMSEVLPGLMTSLPLFLRHPCLQRPCPPFPSVLTPSPLQSFCCIRACGGGERRCAVRTALLTLPVSVLSAAAHRDEKGRDSLTWSFVLKWDLSHTNYTQ